MGGGIMADSPDEIQWHPAFYAAAGLELQENLEDLEFTPEYNLSKEPIRIDLLIRKDCEEPIKNEIGHIMRKYNIIEYKSPKDEMSIDDFAKSLGYALLFNGYPNLPFPVQIIVTKELSPETHSSLRILTDNAEIEDIRRFLEQARKMKRD
jgi:hypothetical protein